MSSVALCWYRGAAKTIDTNFGGNIY